MQEEPQQPNQNTNPPPIENEPPIQHMTPIISPSPKSHKLWWIIGFAVILIAAAAATWWFTKNSAANKSASPHTETNTTGTTQSETNASDTPALALQTTKNYGNKYAKGLLPVGDSKYTTSGGKKGNVYVCSANFVPAGQAGAQTRGPWFVNSNTQWDINKKVSVNGNVMWQQNVTVKIENGKRVVTTNDLPDHHTGVFPVASSDPAYQYDRNPNTITSQSLTYSLAASPAYGTPHCIGGEVGVMTTGVALFDAFDAGGRDAGAWEVQDSCDGHPQNKGEYHYHTLSRCITNTSVQTVIGYALDGFPITGPKVGDNNILTTDDLDECHGIVSDIMLDGKKTNTYHYVMTQDFPYSVSCFRSTPIKAPGLPEDTSSATQPPAGQQPNSPKPY